MHIANSHKELSAESDVDESVRKASSRKAKYMLSFFKGKNNDSGFAFRGLHGCLAEDVGGFRGLYTIVPEVGTRTNKASSGPWTYYGKSFDVVFQLMHGAFFFSAPLAISKTRFRIL